MILQMEFGTAENGTIDTLCGHLKYLLEAREPRHIDNSENYNKTKTTTFSSYQKHNLDTHRKGFQSCFFCFYSNS